MRWLIWIAAVAATGVLAFAQDVIKVNVELVQVYATVTDMNRRFVTDLKAGNFKVFEDGKEQQVEAFSSDDTPLSVGILFDVNGIMGKNLPIMKQAALAFLKAGNVNNEYFVLEFNDKPQITEDYTHDLSRLEDHVHFLDSSRKDATLDAVNAGLEKLRHATNPRRVLLIFTAAAFLKNEHPTVQVRDLARQLDVQIYGITMAETDIYGLNDGYDDGSDVVASVGGETFVPDPDSAQDFLNTCRKIAVGLRNQYIIGYRSTNTEHDGKYRRLQVTLAIPNSPDLFVHTRNGFYAKGPEGQESEIH